MEEKKMRNFLAGLCITSLVAGASLTAPDVAAQEKSG
jgi:radical SAM modification target selenobiotic family peptide